MNTWHFPTQYLAALASLMVLAGGSSVLAQQGLISGWVIEVENESGQPQSDVTVSVVVADEPVTVGKTAADGLIEIPFAGVTIADSTPMDLELITLGGEVHLVATPAGKRSEACDEAEEEDETECEVLAGYLTWGRSGRYRVSTSGHVIVIESPGRGSPSADANGDPSSPVCVEVGAHFGRNVDFKEGFFGIDGRAYLRTLPYPVAIDVILSFYPVEENFKAFAPSFYGSWVFQAAETVEVSAGVGFEFFRSSYDYPGAGSFSDTSTGFGARFEGRYQLNDRIAPVVDAALLKFEGGTEFRLKFGVRAKVFC